MSTTLIKTLSDHAIDAALRQEWATALRLNLEILTLDPNDIPCLNRLAKTYLQTGQPEKAVETYQQVLCLDRYNLIAQKNCERLQKGSSKVFPCNDYTLDTNFVEEPGKTKTFRLVRLGDPHLLISLQPGQIVKIIPKNHTIFISTSEGQHIGALTDDAAFNLKRFLTAGNTYQATIKSLDDNDVSIFIREITRTPDLQNTPTFT